MKHLFSPDGEAALAAVMALRPLLAFDFDGTLAPIVARPDEARVSQAVARRLGRLALALPLAIVSGRRADDVRARLAFEPGYIIGNHGAEDPSLAVDVDLSAVFDRVRLRLHKYAEALDEAGVTVEDKGQSLALHYRLSRDRERAFALIESMTSGLGPDVEVFGGKMVVNVVASDAPDKAYAVTSLVARSGAGSALFVGDDVNDEPVFARAEPSWLTVKVGREDPDSRARFYLDHSGEVASMLDRMLALLDGFSETR